MNSRIIQLVLLPIVAFAFALQVSAAEKMVVGNIRVIKVQGNSAVMVDATGKKSPVQEGAFIRQGTKIITGADSRVDLVFENGSAVNISPSSHFSIDEFIQDPFKSDGLDYRSVEQAPTTSVTKLGVPEGEILFNVAKQKPGSRFEIATPVGTAGIRGTSGFAGRTGFGLATGSASFQTPAGNTVNVSPGTQVSPNGATGPASPALINAVNAAAAELRAGTPPNTFRGSPPNLLPQLQRALDAAEGRGTIVQTASELAVGVPEFAPDIAKMAAILAPNEALAIAVSVSQALPAMAPQVATAVAQVVPAEAPRVAAAVAQTVPESAAAIAQSVSQVVPQQSQAVANAIIEAVPSVDAAAVQQAATQGANQAAQQGGGGATQSGADSRPQPSNINNPPAPPPPPTPTPTPTPTPNPSGL